jgi:AcrR family transcriptional regulator
MPRLTQGQSRERRAGILRAAERVFARYGYDGATVVRLEEETGLSRGAIFYYFANKTELFVAVAHDLNSRFVGLIIERASTMPCARWPNKTLTYSGSSLRS